MHHPADSYGRQTLYADIILLQNFARKITVAFLQTMPYFVLPVCPYSFNKMVFPVVASGFQYVAIYCIM